MRLIECLPLDESNCGRLIGKYEGRSANMQHNQQPIIFQSNEANQQAGQTADTAKIRGHFDLIHHLEAKFLIERP